MNDELTPKTALLSLLYFVLAIIILWTLDMGLMWFFNEVVFDVLDKFNKLSTVLKIIITIVGGFTISLALLQLISRFTTLLGGLVFNRLPQNKFTIYGSFILSIGNALFCIYKLWIIPEGYNFWIIVELLLLSYFVWTLSAIVMPAKEQIKSFNASDRRYT